MIFNTPLVQILDDNDHQTVAMIAAYYSSPANANNLVIQANTLYGGNNSLPCILGVNSLEYNSSIANGFIVLEWVSTSNQNTTIFTTGRNSSGSIPRYIRNLANTPTGDVNLSVVNMEANDTFTIIVSFLKEYEGQILKLSAGNTYISNVHYTYVGPTPNVNHYGAGAWSNAQIHYNQPGVY